MVRGRSQPLTRQEGLRRLFLNPQQLLPVALFVHQLPHHVAKHVAGALYPGLAWGIRMKKEYAKPTLAKRERVAEVSAVTAAPGSLPAR